MSAAFPSCSRKRRRLTLLLLPVTALDRLHAKHVLPGFSDRSAEEREIEAATTEITRVQHFVRPLLHGRALIILAIDRTFADAMFLFSA